MLLQHIVRTLDTELDRLYQLRVIVSGLDTSSEIKANLPALLVEELVPVMLASQAVTPADAASSPQHKPRSRSRAEGAETPTSVPRPKRLKGGATKAKALKGPALSGTIPAGPVVVSAAAVAKEKATKKELQAALKQLPAAPSPGTLGYMIRAVHLDSL